MLCQFLVCSSYFSIFYIFFIFSHIRVLEALFCSSLGKHNDFSTFEFVRVLWKNNVRETVRKCHNDTNFASFLHDRVMFPCRTFIWPESDFCCSLLTFLSSLIPFSVASFSLWTRALPPNQIFRLASWMCNISALPLHLTHGRTCEAPEKRVCEWEKRTPS